jgi:hypothetical protein
MVGDASSRATSCAGWLCRAEYRGPTWIISMANRPSQIPAVVLPLRVTGMPCRTAGPSGEGGDVRTSGARPGCDRSAQKTKTTKTILYAIHGNIKPNKSIIKDVKTNF